MGCNDNFEPNEEECNGCINWRYGTCMYEERRRIRDKGVVEMILFEKYYGRERYECWTRVFNNIDELIIFLQEHKEHLLSTPDRNKHFKIVATMYNKGEIGEFLGFNE